MWEGDKDQNTPIPISISSDYNGSFKKTYNLYQAFNLNCCVKGNMKIYHVNEYSGLKNETMQRAV